MARLLILWVDESLEDRARSLSAERLGLLRVSRRSEVRPLESRPMMRAPEAAVAIRLSKATRRRGGARIVQQFDNRAHCVPAQFFVPFGQTSARLAADCVNTSFTDRRSPLRAWTSKRRRPKPSESRCRYSREAHYPAQASLTSTEAEASRA